MGMGTPSELSGAADVFRQTMPIRVGIIGLDAHAVPWTQIISEPSAAINSPERASSPPPVVSDCCHNP